MDFSIRLSNKQLLQGIIESPGENIKAGIILVHGLGEHIGRWSAWIKRFNDNRIIVAGVDLPGHGISDGKRGVMKNYTFVNEMLDVLIDEFRKTFPGIPVFLYGHSLGGGVVLEYILKKKPTIKGAIVTSPWLKLSFEPDKSKLILVRIIKSILPSLVQPSGLVVDHLSNDSTVITKYINDPLVHDRISVGLFHAAVTAGDFSLENAEILNIPVLLMHGSKDSITSPAGSREFASKTNKVHLKIWDEGFHELHNEPFKDEVFDYINDWIEKTI
jgi:alpha-beta hydrolase superfamily lysophospholipase